MVKCVYVYNRLLECAKGTSHTAFQDSLVLIVSVQPRREDFVIGKTASTLKKGERVWCCKTSAKEVSSIVQTKTNGRTGARVSKYSAL